MSYRGPDAVLGGADPHREDPMPPRRPSTAAAASLFPLLLLGSPPAQDMVAVGWDGRVHAFDSRSGRHDLLAVTAMGQNALARDAAGQLWSTARLPAGAGYSFHLTRIDATTGSGSIAFPSVDLRGLAAAPTGLHGIETLPGGASSRLWHIDTQTGSHVLLGNVGLTAIQSLAVHQGVLYGWHWVQGLVVLDPRTGLASDPYAATAGGLVIQWLASEPGGGLIGGAGTGVYGIDVATGGAVLRAQVSPLLDLRGAEFASFALPYGSGCDIGNGPLQLSAAGALQPGGFVTLESRNHLPGTLRGLAVGFARDRYENQPLPLLLDPLLGTSGCSLYVRIDLSQLYLGSGFPTTVMALPLPVLPGIQDLYVQHFDFARPFSPPGSSNGLWLHVR